MHSVYMNCNVRKQGQKQVKIPKTLTTGLKEVNRFQIELYIFSKLHILFTATCMTCMCKLLGIGNC